MLNLSKEKLLIIIALVLAGISLTVSIVLGLQVIKLKQDLTHQPFPTSIPTVTPTPKLELSPIPSPKVSPTPISKEKLPSEAKACQKDENCFLGISEACLSVCDPCIMGDVSEPVWEALNKNWCQETRRSIRESLERKDFLCPACISGYSNKYNIQAKCMNGLCAKIETSGEISPSLTPTPGQRCGTYSHNGRKETHCATCGNSICEPFEGCTPSSCISEACTGDCGPLYCKKDCE